MRTINQEIGNKIRLYRKTRKMTIAELGQKIYKSRATVSKYEKGEIVLDVETLYAIAAALKVRVEHLLYQVPDPDITVANEECPAFFAEISRFYGYLFDGRKNKLLRCVYEILAPLEKNRYKVEMFMEPPVLAEYRKCETSYWGAIEHFDAVTNILLTNQMSPMDKASVQILAPYLESSVKWGLFNGFSLRPMMPIAGKMLFSRQPLQEDSALVEKLKISKEDIRLLRLYNMLPVM